jgi:hypothetical protein
MTSNVAKGTHKLLSEHNKSAVMSDTSIYSVEMRDAFPKARYGGAKAAVYAAYRFISPRVKKIFTERRARSIWEGAARRIDAEEAAVIRLAKIEENRREYQEIKQRLHSLEAALAAADEAMPGPSLDACGPLANVMGRMDLPGNRRG